MSTGDRARYVRVGLFLLATVVLLAFTVFQLGRSQSLFSRKILLKASFSDVSGLVIGAPVRLAGLDIGIVQRIDFDSELSVRKVHLVMGVERQYLSRIRADSIARLASKGLLGDTIINISVGSADAAPLAAGAELNSAESAGAAEVIDEVKEAVGALRSLTGKVESRVDEVITDQVARDVQRITHSIAGVVEEVQRGRGLAHALVYDPGMSADARRLLGDADQAVGHVRRIVAAVEQRPGLLHGLIYDEQGGAALADLRRAASEIADLTAAVRGGRGLLHALVYEEEQAALLTNLTELSKTLRRIGDDVERGQGTVGGLLRDPTVYEDLKLILGKVERNRLLKALVRYTIKSDGLKP